MQMQIGKQGTIYQAELENRPKMPYKERKRKDSVMFIKRRQNVGLTTNRG
jgi:hypothetical protein